MRQACPKCGDSRSRSIRQEGQWLRWYCFRCEEGGRDRAGPRTPPLPETGRKQRSKPQGHIPENYLAWLGKYGISWPEAEAYGCFWDGYRLTFNCPAFQARRSITDRPKWLVVEDNPSAFWGWGEAGKPIVIVEDSVAALKAAMAGLRGFPMLGTYGRYDKVPRNAPIHILPDPDNAGTMAAWRHVKALRGAKIHETGIEPKELPFSFFEDLSK